MRNLRSIAAATSASLLVVAVACSGSSTSGSNPGGGTQSTTGQSCSAASQCYPLVDAAAVHGTVTCLTQGISTGYCTHTCTSDGDCCAVPGECLSGFAEVCAPFESTGQNYCFLSCAASAIGAAPDAGTTDPNTYCQRYANASFTCRSTGGGRNNQQFCGP